MLYHVFIYIIFNYLQFILNNLEKKTIKCIVFQKELYICSVLAMQLVYKTNKNGY